MSSDTIINGYDTGYFAHCLTGATRLPESLLNCQYFGDIRDISEDLISRHDAIVHLSAISNDPIGNKFEAMTQAINEQASHRLATLAVKHGVKKFVFASSCSIYGAAGDEARRENDPKNPLTAYARSKVFMENVLESHSATAMTTTCLRFATACGFSDRLRLDLVLNDFVATAMIDKKITILSDGTPWRPLVHVADMSRAIEWALVRPESVGGSFLPINIGSNEWNFQVIELANAVAELVNIDLIEINKDAAPDKRSYRVSFDLFKQLAPAHQPIYSLRDTIRDLKNGLSPLLASLNDFRNSHYIRLKTLSEHIDMGRLGHDLRWLV